MTQPNTSVPALPVYVPIALPLREAQATFQALRVAFDQLTIGGIMPPDFSAAEKQQIQGVYARAMVAVGEAIDKVTGASDE